MLKSIIHAFINRAPRPSHYEMQQQVDRTTMLINTASTSVILDLLENKVAQIAEYYKHETVTQYLVNGLHKLILQRRCELIAVHSPENEEAQ